MKILIRMKKTLDHSEVVADKVVSWINELYAS